MSTHSALGTDLPGRDARTENLRFSARLACVVGVAAALRIAYLLDVHAQGVLWDAAFLDAELYRAIGHAIASGSWEGGVFTLGPLYPLVLAGIERVFGPGNAPVYLLQQALGLGTMTLTGLMGRRIGGETAGLVAAAAIGFQPALAQLEVKFMSTVLAVFLSTLLLWLLMQLRERRTSTLACVSGLVLGLACLTRANLLVFAPAAALWLLLRRGEDGLWRVRPRDLALTALLTLATLATIAPATLHNHRASGERILISSQGGLTFYHANNPRAVGSYSAAEGFSGHPAWLDQEARRMAEAARGRTLTRSEISQYFYEKGMDYLLEHPLQGALLIGRKALHWIANAELGTEYVVAMEREYTPTLWAFFVPFAAVLALAVAGLVLAPRVTPDLALLLVMIGVNLATLLAFYVVSRYRLTAVPSLAILAGLGVAQLRAGLAATPTRPLALKAACVGVAVLAVSLVPSREVLSNQVAAEHYNVGNVHFGRGEYAAATHFYERALERMNREWTAHFNLGLAHARLSAWDPAIDAFERVVELAPDNALAAAALREARCAREPAPGCPLGLAQSAD